MIYYPVIIPTLNRFEHFKKCVESLLQCTHAEKTEIVIGLDFPPKEHYKNGYLKIKEYIPKIKGFLKVTLFEHQHNLGAIKNEQFLRDYAFQHYDAYIATEDDNIFSPAFLDYMNKALNAYKNNQNVAFVCAYSYPIIWENKENVFLQHQYFSAWGFGEWKDKWLKMEKDFTTDYLGHYLENHHNRQELFKLSEKLYRYATVFSMLNKMPFHDAARCIYMAISRQNTLMPRISLVRNIGWDGSGLNCPLKYKEEFENQVLNENKTFDLNDITSAPIIESENLEIYQQEFMGDFPHYKIIADEIYMLLGKYGYHKAKSIYLNRMDFQSNVQVLKIKYKKENALNLKELAPKMAGLTLKQKMCLFFSKNKILWCFFNFIGNIRFWKK